MNVMLTPTGIPRFLGWRCHEIVIDEHNMEKAVDKYLELRNRVINHINFKLEKEKIEQLNKIIEEANSLMYKAKCLF